MSKQIKIDSKFQKYVEQASQAMKGLVEEKTNELNAIKDRIREQKKKEQYLWEKQKQATHPESSRILNERMLILAYVKILEADILQKENIVKAIENGGRISSITDKKGVLHNELPDFRRINTNEIEFDEETILNAKPPAYIPIIDEKKFANKGHVFDSIRIDEDSYLLAIKEHIEPRSDQRESKKTDYDVVTAKTNGTAPYVVTTLDQLVLSVEYYTLKSKARLKKEAEERTIRNEQRWDRLPEERRKSFYTQFNQKAIYNSMPVKIKKSIAFEDWEKIDWKEKEKIFKFYKREGAKRPKSKLRENYMWASFHKMYERFVNPGAIQPNARTANQEAFDYWRMFREMLNYKINDLEIQRQDLSESRQKAIETSFGLSNTNDILKKKYGILVKMQDGSDIRPTEIEQIRKAYSEVQKSIGNLKPNAEKYNLKITHTGQKYVFASNAIGMYVPSMSAIAVSDKYGGEQFVSTLAHEISHFIDNIVGELNGKRFATDNYESTAGKIAFEFRRYMNKKQQSKYINATKECFARAIQQYCSLKIFGQEAKVIYSYFDLIEGMPIYAIDHFVNKENFEAKIKPLIEQFFEEQKDVFKYTIDVDDSDELPELNNEKELKDKEEQRKKVLDYLEQRKQGSRTASPKTEQEPEQEQDQQLKAKARARRLRLLLLKIKV